MKELATAYVLEPFSEVPVEDPEHADVPLRMLWQWEAIGENTESVFVGIFIRARFLYACQEAKGRNPGNSGV